MTINSHHPTRWLAKLDLKLFPRALAQVRKKINPQQLLSTERVYRFQYVSQKEKKKVSAGFRCQHDRQWRSWVASSRAFRPWAGSEPRSSATWRHPGFQTLAGMPQSVTIRLLLVFLFWLFDKMSSGECLVLGWLVFQAVESQSRFASENIIKCWRLACPLLEESA